MSLVKLPKFYKPIKKTYNNEMCQLHNYCIKLNPSHKYKCWVHLILLFTSQFMVLLAQALQSGFVDSYLGHV